MALFSWRPRRSVPLGTALAAVVLLMSSQLAVAQLTQQGPKLVGSGASGAAAQGFSVVLSADGNTAIVGGPADNSGTGAAWVFTRSGGVWTPQGNKLIGTGASSPAQQGFSVALSADGNTAVVGGPGDNSGAGAAWVFTRSGGMWTQQGNKLVGGDASLPAQQGQSVALSADGNTAIVGGPFDNSDTGAAWVFTRSGGAWTQQGKKLVGSGASGAAAQGASVALSADGNTAVVGGPFDNSQAGAAWVFIRSGGVWTPQGNKLVGSGASSPAEQGFSVALSAAGNIAVVGGPFDNSSAGAAWVFGRSGGVWTPRGNKLVGSGASANAQQAQSVALSANGKTAVLGGPFDSASGAAWPFAQPEVPFASFTVKLTISSYKPGFALTSHFTLGVGSSGINPLYEAVTLTINSFTVTIPPFSFSPCGAGCYAFNGIINGLTAKASITQTSANAYTFQASANPNLSRTKDPATVTLIIGNDTGTTTVRF
jgi:antibiotic biosynthesis monooxygenase (ABM) superfamily enzyme